MKKAYELEEAVRFEGLGLHSGVETTLEVRGRGDGGEGIVFVRGDKRVEARADRVELRPLCTMIRGDDGTEFYTVEHVMSSLFMMGIVSAEVECAGPEVPILDGSARGFVEGLRRAKKREVGDVGWIDVKERVEVKSEDGGSWVVCDPVEGERMELLFELEYDTPYIGHQSLALVWGEGGDDVVDRVWDARTFCLLEDLERVRAMGLGKGGSLENAVVIGADGVLNAGGFRGEDECVRHKMMDALGDLWTLGKYVKGRIHFHKSGHGLNNMLARRLMGLEGGE
jgi:UDP-3-O-[3-hydroxymyristoyl] N-acetylglucosamine deacetylase